MGQCTGCLVVKYPFSNCKQCVMKRIILSFTTYDLMACAETVSAIYYQLSNEWQLLNRQLVCVTFTGCSSLEHKLILILFQHWNKWCLKTAVQGKWDCESVALFSCCVVSVEVPDCQDKPIPCYSHSVKPQFFTPDASLKFSLPLPGRLRGLTHV